MARLLWPGVGLVLHAVAFFLVKYLFGIPVDALGTLGWLSAFGVCSIAIFLFVTSFTYRSNGTSGGVGAMLLLLTVIGGISVSTSVVAAIVGAGLIVTVVGTTLAAIATTFVTVALGE